MLINQFKCMYWNIHGISSKILGNKTKDPEFLKIILEWDIIGLSELHTDKPISIPGFSVKKQKIRPKLHNGPKIGGGIAVLIRDNIADKFQLIPNNNVDSIWIKTSKTLMGKETRIGFYYCSPEINNTSSFFELVNHEVESFNNKENTFIFGDFNARIKTENETVMQDKFDELLGIETEIQIEPLFRNSEDMKIINQRGREFLDICRINNFIVANGRRIGDIFGKYTCHQKKGSSVVDYLISTYNAFKKNSFFKVGEISPLLSDHCPITAIISVEFEQESKQNNNTKMYQLEKRYIWNSVNDETFRERLSSPLSADKVHYLSETVVCPKQLALEIRNLIIEIADLCEIKKINKKRETTNKPWFDKECNKIKNHIKKKVKY